MDALADISTYIRGSKSPGGRYIDEGGGPRLFHEPGTYMASMAASVIPWTPFVAVGPWGAPVAGVLAGGMEHAEEREAIRSAPAEVMADNPRYQELIKSGLTFAQAREALTQEVSDPTNPQTWLRRTPAIAGNMVGTGLGLAAAKRGLRLGSNEMADRIINKFAGGSAFKQAGLGAGLGAATGYAQGAGTDLSRQLGEVASGLKKEVDYGQVGYAGVEPGALFGGLGAAGHGVARVRQISAQRAEARRVEAERLLKEEEAARAIPPIGTDILTTARADAIDDGPEPPPPPPGAGGEVPDFRERFRPVPWAPTEGRSGVTPPPGEGRPMVDPYADFEPPDFRDRFRGEMGAPIRRPPPSPDPFAPVGQRMPTPPEPYERAPPPPAGRAPTVDPWVPPGARRTPEVEGPWVPRGMYDPNAPRVDPSTIPVRPDQPYPLPGDGGEPWAPRGTPRPPAPAPDASWAPRTEPYGPPVTEAPPVEVPPAPPAPRAPRVRKAEEPAVVEEAKAEPARTGVTEEEKANALATAKSLKKGDVIVNEFGDRLEVAEAITNKKSGETVAIVVRREDGSHEGFKADEIAGEFMPIPYTDANTGERKWGKASTVERGKPKPKDEPPAPRDEPPPPKPPEPDKGGEAAAKEEKSVAKEEVKAEVEAKVEARPEPVAEEVKKEDGKKVEAKGKEIVKRVRAKKEAKKVEDEDAEDDGETRVKKRPQVETEEGLPDAPAIDPDRAAIEAFIAEKGGVTKVKSRVIPGSTVKSKRVAEVIEKVATAAEEQRTQLIEKLGDTTLGARLSDLQRLAVEKLKTALKDNPDAPISTLAKQALDEAYQSPDYYLQRAKEQIEKEDIERKTITNTRWAARVKPVFKRRERAASIGLRGTSLGEPIEGSNQSVREQFAQLVDLAGKKIIQLKDADPAGLSDLTGNLIENATDRVKMALFAMKDEEKKGGPNTGQIPWGLPRSRSKAWQQAPWYDMIYQLESAKEALIRTTEPGAGQHDRVVSKRGAGIVRTIITDMMVLDLAIESGKPELWDRFTKERARGEYEALHDKRKFLENQIALHEGYKELIDYGEPNVEHYEARRKEEAARQGRQLKEETSDQKYEAAKRAYEEAVKKYDPDVIKYRTAELKKQIAKIESVNEQLGIDLYSDDVKKALDFENRLHELMEEHAGYATFSERFFKEELLDAEDELKIQRAYNEGWINLQERNLGYTRRQQLEKGTTGVVAHAPGDEYLNRRDRRRLVQLDRNDPTDTAFIDVGERGRRIKLAEVLDPQPRRPDYSQAKPVRELPSEARKREWEAGRKSLEVLDAAERLDLALDALPLHEAASYERVREIDDRLKALQDEARELAMRVNPWMMSNDYSVGRILDPAAELIKNGRPVKGNLPNGAYVKSVREMVRFARGKDMESRASRLRNHVLDVANRLFGQMDVVGLTNEQMMLAATKRMLPADTPSFYDPKAQRIFISHDVGRLDSPAFNRALAHEIVHPLSEVALDAFPEIAARIENVYKLFAQQVMKGTTKAARLMEGREHALMNKHEFLSEFLGDDGSVQAALDTIRVTAAERDRIAGEKGGFVTALKRMTDLLGDALRALFLREKHSTLLSDAMVHSLDLFRALEHDPRARDADGVLIRPKGTEARPMAAGDWLDAATHTKTAEEKHMDDTRSWVARSAARIAHNWSRMDGRTGAFLWGHDLSQQARRFEPGMQKRTEAVRTAMAHAYTGYRRNMEKAKVEDTAEQIGKTHDLNAEAFKRFMLHLDKENHFEVSGSELIGVGRNKWIHPTSLEHAQFRAAHAELAADYVHMPKQLRDLRETLFDKYSKRHEELAVATVDQLVEIAGHKRADGTFVPMAPDPATRKVLVRYLRDKESITPAERSLLEAKVRGFSYDIDRKRKDPEYKKFREQVKDIREAAHLAKRPGVWLPSFRRGDWVSEGYFNLAKHGDRFGGVELDKDNQGTRGAWEFADEASRDKFVAAIAADPVLRKVKFRGMAEYVDEDTGVHTWRATYNPLMLDFFQHQHEAFEHQKYLKDTFGDDMVINHVEPRKADSATYLNPVQADRALSAMVASLKRSEGWDNLDAVSRNKLIQGLNEGAVRHIMSASKRATYLPKNYALGARKDVMQDFLEYFTNTSYSLGELESRNEMKAAFKGLDEYVRDMKSSRDFGQNAIGRKQLQASLHRRADWRPDPILTPTWRKALNRTLQLSYLDKLLSPMNWVLNYTELWMAGAPLGAGIHGARFYGELVKATHDVGLFRYLDGFKDAKDVYKAGVGGVPRLDDVPKRFKELTKDLPDAAEIHALIDRYEEYGHLDRDSSMEVGRIFDPTAGKAFRAVDWADNITRQISANIDNVNRLVYGIALLRASKAGKGAIATLDGRLAHAEHYTGKMAGNYSKYNEAEMFRHPALGPALQFKRYAQRTTANWIGVVYHSFAKDVPAEHKAAARMQLMYMMGTIIAVSGVLGLPTEPIKGVINAFSPISGFNSDDAEDLVRRGLAAGVGKDLGYALSRGIPRAWLNMGIGTRLGQDSMWTQGAPDTRRPEGIYAAAGHLAVGAPGAYVIEGLTGLGRMGRGIGHMISGNTSEGWNDLRHGAQLAMPFKAGVDNLDAAVKYFGGPQTRTRFGQPLGYQPTVADTAMQMLGLQSGNVQERGDLRRRVSRDQSIRQEMATEAFARYVYADTPGEKTAVRKQAMDAYNSRWPEDKLTVADFLRADQRHKKKMQESERYPERAGLTMTRAQQRFLPRYEAYVQ